MDTLQGKHFLFLVSSYNKNGKSNIRKKSDFFLSILIAVNTGFYILGKAMANGGEKELFSLPLIIAVSLSILSGIFSVFRKK